MRWPPKEICSAFRNAIAVRKVTALIEPYDAAIAEALAAPVLRHRILINYRAEADGVTVDKVIAKLVEHVRTATA